MTEHSDPILRSIVRELTQKHCCHTVVLYGSRARGLNTPTSDYDVIGIRGTGRKLRIAKRQNGFYWDVFIYPEKDLRKLKEEHFAWKNAQVLHEEGRYGSVLLRRIAKLLRKPYKAQPRYEINTTRVWAQKELDRCRMKDIQGLFRRAEFQAVLIEHYFFMRQKRFLGPKEGFTWLKENDPKTFSLIQRALKFPAQLSFLKAAASCVYGVSLK